MQSNRPPHTCVYGLGWGDEGKGKAVDLLCPAFDYVVRFNGGANAGHTVCVEGEKFALHLLPTGALHDGVCAVIGPGVVVDPITLLEEIDGLHRRKIDISNRLKISERAHLVLPYHKLEDQLSEKLAGEAGQIGTTSRGIGPCYADMMRRTSAVRFADLIHSSDWPKRIRSITAARMKWLQALLGECGDLDPEKIILDLTEARRRLGSLVCDTTELLHDALDQDRPVLFEGANGLLLDVYHGTYPFVTSSTTGPHGIGGGAGVPPSMVSCRIGVTKAYSTRVGRGPFVSELKDDMGERIRTRGREFGTTTGRPRRCGWFDAVMCRYSAATGGATDMAIMHLDTLSGFEKVGICVAYRCEGAVLTWPPADVGRLDRCEPVLEFLPGWGEDLRSIRCFEQLPPAARGFISKIESLVGVPVSMAGVGPDRSQALLRGTMMTMVSAANTAAV